MAREVVDEASTVSDLETAQEYDVAQKLTENRAGNEKLAERAAKMVYDCLAGAESSVRSRQGRWRDAERLNRLQSLSENADEFDVHLGRPLKDLEEWSGKMDQAVFGSRNALVGGSVEDEGDRKKAELAMALIEDQVLNEAHLAKRSLENFRATGMYGTRFAKVVPRKDRIFSFRQGKKMVELPDSSGKRLVFDEPKEIEQAIDKLEVTPVSVYDFRCPDNADDIESASWCGDYSYPTNADVLAAVERGEYDEAAVNKAMDWLSNQKPDERAPVGGSTPGFRVGRTESGVLSVDRASPEDSPNIEEFCAFEWYGLFDIDEDGIPKPCLVTILLPAHDNRPHFGTVGAMTSWVVRLQRNPFFHQKKPYVFHPVRKEHGTVYSMSIMDLSARQSRYEDEMWTLGLTGAMLESSPPLEIGEAADITADELDGFLPGKRIPVEQTGSIKSIDLGRGSGVAAQWATVMEQKGTDLVGLGGREAAPRVAAAGILDQASKEDLRTLMYVNSYEQYFLMPLFEFAHAYNKQYMTEERAVRTLGVRGSKARTIETINPEEVSVDIQFEPMVGRKLKQKVFQAQHLLNHRDRLMMTNQMNAQMGQPQYADLAEVDRRILQDGMGIMDVESIILPGHDPQSVFTAHEEHRLFAQGQRPGVNKAENKMMHFMAHSRFLSEGRAEGWTPEDRQALIDHTYDTLDDLYRELETSMPDVATMVSMQLEQSMQGLEATNPGQGDFYNRLGQSQQQMQGMVQGMAQSGGRGAASPTQSQGSPLFRGPGSGGMGQPNATNSGQA